MPKADRIAWWIIAITIGGLLCLKIVSFIYHVEMLQ
jgi:hypothetical protein